MHSCGEAAEGCSQEERIRSWEVKFSGPGTSISSPSTPSAPPAEEPLYASTPVLIIVNGRGLLIHAKPMPDIPWHCLGLDEEPARQLESECDGEDLLDPVHYRQLVNSLCAGS